MKKTLKWLVLLIVIMGFAITTVVYADNTHNHNNINWTAWESATSLPHNPGNYYLANDVTLSATWNVPIGTVNLCLNGKGIKAGGSNFRVIRVPFGANLTVYDCDTTTEHKYTVTDGLATVNDSATGDEVKNFTGGYITGGKAETDAGGGVYVVGKFTLSGGTIIGNTAVSGGGVYTFTGSEFSMTGGKITYNTASDYGGGVFNSSNCYLNGGSIIHNSVPVGKPGGGVYAKYSEKYVNVGGPIVIMDNYSSTNQNNMYLDKSDEQYWKIKVTGKLISESGDKAFIGVTMGSSDGKGTFTTGYASGGMGETAYTNDADPSTYFFSDDIGLHVEKDGNEAKLETGHKHDDLDLIFTAWDSNNSLPSGNDLTEGIGYYYLTQDVTFSGAWDVPTGTLNLCLNGHKIINGNTNLGNNINVKSGSTLNLYDEIGNSGVITRNNDADSSLISVNGGEFNLYGGQITGKNGVGVFVYEDGNNNPGKFNMHGGVITGNVKGGVCLYATGSEFTMDGGEITGNKMGVQVSQGTFNLSGGSVTQNTGGSDQPFGIMVHDTFKLSGNPVIKDNGVLNANGNAIKKPVNVWLYGSAKITINGALSNTDKIGVTMQNPGAFTSGLDEKLPDGKTVSDFFYSDSDDYYVSQTTAGEAELKQLVRYPLWVGGIQVTNANLSGTGWSFTPADTTSNTPATLTLNGFSYEGAATGIEYQGTDALNFVLTGTNTITSTEYQGIVAKNNSDSSTTGDLVFSGDGSLTVTGANGGIHAEKNITFDSGTLTAEGSTGIVTSLGGITISGGSVTATGTSESGSGFSVNTGLSIGSNVTSVVASGSKNAIGGLGKVTNTVFGTGWTNTAGTAGATTIEPNTSGEYLNYQKVQFPGVHLHNLSYTPSQTGDSVTVTCTSTYGICDLPNTGVKLTIQAPTNLYVNGQAKEATLDGLDAFNTATGKSLSADSITYASVDPSTQATTALDSAPTTAGSYQASLKYGENATDVITVSYTIRQRSSGGGYTTTYTVTFTVVNGAWDDGTKTNKSVTTNRLTSSQIPSVGSRPDEGYAAGSWSPVPSTSATISKNTTYTYTYAEKPLPTVTAAPQGKDLTETGDAQELVTAGTATGGTMQYSLGSSDGTYSSTIPKATEAGTYYVWYKVKGDADHRDTDPTSIEVTIKENTKPAATIVTAPTAKDLVFTGEAQELVYPGEASGGTMEYGVGITRPSSFSTSIPTSNAAGTYTVWYRAKGDEEHSNSAVQSLVVTIKYGENTLVYNGEEQDLVIAGSAEGGTMLYALGTDDKIAPGEGWSETVPTGKDVGPYYVWYRIDGDENHNDVDPVCIKVTIVPDSQVSQFEEGLKTLPENVTRDDEELVEALRTLYDGLRADQKSQIPDEDLKKLEAAENTLEELKAEDQGKADAVATLIDQLPDNAKPENKTAVDAVLKQYEALTDDQKALLPEAEKEKIEALKAAFAGPSEEDQAVATNFTESVNALPTNKAGEVKAQLDNMTEMLSSMTEEQKALIPESTMAAYQEAVDAFKPGRQFCSGDGYYKVLSNGDVTYHHPADEMITSAVVPNQVKKGKFLFKVIKVSNYAFDGCENLEWIVIHKNVRVIGEDAFNDTPKLTKINIKGSGIVSGKVTDAFEGAGKNLTVKVPSKKLDEYKRLFTSEGGLDGSVRAA